MKKIIFGMLFLLFGFFLACGQSASSKSQLKGDLDDFVSEKWLDENTFQVRAIGAPSPDAKGFVRRRTQAEEAALLAAQKRVIELCVGAEIKGASGADSGESTGVVITKEFEGVVRGGQIVRKTFDQDDNCEITYRVQSKGLKKQCEAMAAKKDFR